ncbi:MAG: hypothetical protein KIT46_03515 [Anaerolineales bacterium]|nr:hypothetical protein [Anaerolineales bacterium]MCW5855094.1 hypothetical protein [Anaerolineales bacterium]
MSKNSLVVACVLAGFLVACGSPTLSEETPPPTAAAVIPFTAGSPAQLEAGDALQLVGDGTGVSETFTLTESSRIRLSWDQTAGENFLLYVQSTTDPANRVQFVFQTTPGEGSGDWIFNAGEYIVEVEGEGSQWRITLDLVEYMSSPLDLLED